MLESTLLLPKHDSRRSRPPTVIPLHELDTMIPPIHIEIRYFFHTPQNSFPSLVDKLKSSLAEALDIYSPVAGTVLVNDNSESWIATDSANIQPTPFIVDVKNFPFQRETEELSPRNGLFLPLYSPIFAVKLSYFSCGTLIMATSIHHQVADLRANLDFVENWAALSRGETVDITKLPTDWLRRPMKYFDGLYTEAVGSSPPPGYSVLPNPPTETPSFSASEITCWNFTKQQIENLKSDFLPQTTNSSTSDQWISAGDALASLCWGANTRARRDGNIPRSPFSDPTNERLAMAADGRDRAPRGDVQSYLGNFNLLISTSVPRKDLILPTPEAASRVALGIRQAIRDQLHPKAIAHKISFLESPENTRPAGRITWFGDVVMTNWCKWALAGHAVDFGWGEPFHVTTGGGVFPPGYVRMLKVDLSSGAISVLITIEVPAANFLKSDSLLTRYGVLL